MKEVCKMNIPAYTAECSLYNSTRAYAATSRHAAVSGDALVPAAAKYCRNTRPGWAIPNTLCGECADFAIRRVCLGGKCRLEWVQVSDWKWECWPTKVAPD